RGRFQGAAARLELRLAGVAALRQAVDRAELVGSVLQMGRRNLDGGLLARVVTHAGSTHSACTRSNASPMCVIMWAVSRSTTSSSRLAMMPRNSSTWAGGSVWANARTRAARRGVY